MPWAELVALIEPGYPRADGSDHPPVGIERMLRLHCLQKWFNQSDPATEDALYNSRARGSSWALRRARSVIQTKAHYHRHLSEIERARNRMKSKAWATAHYCGLAKTPHWLFITRGLVNLYVPRRQPWPRHRGWGSTC